MLLWLQVFRRHTAPMQCGARFRDACVIVFNNRFFDHINFQFDQKGIENGIEEHLKLEKPKVLGHD